MLITKGHITAIMPNAERNVRRNPHTSSNTIDDVLRIFNHNAKVFGLETSMQWAFFLSQVAHESAELRYTEEIASGAAYDTGILAQRLGNTPQKDGDGQKYKGRGYIQITGRANIKEYSDYLQKGGMRVDLLKTPELLSKITGACKSAMWFFYKNGLNRYADNAMANHTRENIYKQFKALTRAVNGGYNGLEERERYLSRALQVFGYI